MVNTVARDVAFRYAVVHFATCPTKNGRAVGPSDEPAQAVDRYLGSLQSQWRRRRMRLTREAILARLEALRCQLPAARSVARLNLVQKRRDLEADLRVLDASRGLQGLENDFVAIARDFGRRERISYSDWRDLGVPRVVLCEAGIGSGERDDDSLAPTVFAVESRERRGRTAYAIPDEVRREAANGTFEDQSSSAGRQGSRRAPTIRH